MPDATIVDCTRRFTWQGVVAPSGPLSYNSQSDVVIVGRTFTSIAGPAVMLEGCRAVYILGCTFTDVGSAVAALNCTDVVVVGCKATNILGPHGDNYKGNFVQFDKVTGGRIAANRVTNPGTSDPEDLISVYQSTDVDVIGNFLQGGGPSTSGSGILVGDNGGSGHRVSRNVCVDTGNVGIGIVGGSDIEVSDNLIFSTQTAVSNIGLYVANYASTRDPSGIVVARNRINWTNKNGQGNHLWDRGDMGPVAGWATNRQGGAALPAAPN